MLPFGRYELHAIETGRFRLDGGAMFGVVPKVLWSRSACPDELNRIGLAMRCLLAVDRASRRVILVDSGAGDKWSREDRQRYAFEWAADPLAEGLRGCGLTENDVTDVVVTHLHFDHNGGLTVPSAEGGESFRPRFPEARHWVHSSHLAYAGRPTPKDRASFWLRDYQAVREAGLFELLDGEHPACPFPDVEWLLAHGHTPYQLLPRFCDGRRAVQFLADLIPTVSHLPLPWVMAYDNEPLRTIQEKRMLYELCTERDLILFFEHDPQVAAARIDTATDKPHIVDAVSL